MKLLLDENISDRIIPHIAELFPASAHVKSTGLAQADDDSIWSWAKLHRFTILSKDIDFYQRSIVLGHPPKFVWLRVGNCPTSLIVTLLKSHAELIRQFIESPTESLLVLER